MPEWVTKRDGRLVPFDPDKISQALFAATESLGRPDSFLARELTGSVLHFLAAETAGTAPTTAQVAELVAKVVRELGEPALANAFTTTRERKPRDHAPKPESVLSQLGPGENSLALVKRQGAASVAPHALRTVFAADVAWTHAEGLLSLTGLEAPFELAGWLMPPSGPRLVEALEAARNIVGGWVAIDGPEHVLGRQPAAEYVRELAIGLRVTGLQAIVNLNSAAPPIWAGPLAVGPLFGEPQPAASATDEAAAALRDLLLQDGLRERVRVDWHLSERDFAEPGRLAPLVRRALDGASLAFAFDRPRRPVPLADGIDRQHPAVLLAVGLHLPRLLEATDGTPIRHGPEAADTSGDPRSIRIPSVANELRSFLRKLGSLARLALSAGVQKRAFLRRLQRSWPPFLLDRARLFVTPFGLESAVRQLTGAGSGTELGLSVARQIVQELAHVLHEEGPGYQLEACVGDGGLAEESARVSAAVKQHIKTAGALHHAAATVSILVPSGTPLGAEEVVEVLHWTWKHTEVARLRLVRDGSKAENMLLTT